MTTVNPGASHQAPTDAQSGAITIHWLNGHNYLQWANGVRLYVTGKGKIDYLTGKKARPSPTDPSYGEWEAENSMVQCWIINSMTTDISAGFSLFQSAKDVWDAVWDMFASVKNRAAILEIETNLDNLRQGNLSINEYWTNLLILWQQLDAYEIYEWSTPADSMLYAKIKEEKRIYKLLLGLNPSYDATRARIMSQETLPSLRDVFFIIKQEESLQNLPFPKQQSSNEAVTGAFHSKGDNRSKRSGKWCEHCQKAGHTKDICWKLHGKPPNNRDKGKQEGRGFTTETKSDSEDKMSKEDIEFLRKILDKHDSQ